MTARLNRFITWTWPVWFAAWSMRHGLSPEQVMDALTRAYRHRDGAWRLAVLEAAQDRNRRRDHAAA